MYGGFLIRGSTLTLTRWERGDKSWVTPDGINVHEETTVLLSTVLTSLITMNVALFVGNSIGKSLILWEMCFPQGNKHRPAAPLSSN